MPTKSTLPTPLPDFRLMFESAPALYLALTADLMIVAASDTYLRATKTNREDILGRGVFDVFPDDPDDPIATVVRNSRASFERVVKGRVSDVMAVQQHAMRRPESEGGGFEERYWSPVNSPVLGPNGEVAYIIHQVEDVTEFVRLRPPGVEQDTFAQELGTRGEQMEASVLDHTPDGIISVDDRGTISLFSRAAERIFNYLASEVLGQNVKMLMPEPYQSEHDRYLATYLRTGEAKIIGTSREVEGRRKDGSTFPLNLAVTEFELDRHRLFLANVRDISAQKKMEAQLRQAQKMEAVGQLAGGVAHDFNNLLTIISGYSEILLSRMAPNDPMRRSILSISQAGEHAASLTRQLLAFSRQTVMEPKVVDLNGAVRETEMMLRRLIGEDIVLTTVLDPHISRVKLDPSLLTQVLMNLSVNARDAMPEGGTLTLETRNVDLDQKYADTHVDVRAGPYVMVAVSDTGVGMTPETQVRIFEPFFTTKGIGKGTGLGLSVVHGIVKQSGGHIEVQSELNRGATFRFYFPAVEAQADAATPSDREAGVRGTETILLVEDNDGVRDLASLVLQTHGYTVLAASDGTDALRVADTHRRPIDLLVTDVVMPGMDGRQVAEALLPRFPQMKVLFSSGYTDDAMVRHGIVQAEVAFLQKPYLPEALARKVRQALDQP